MTDVEEIIDYIKSLKKGFDKELFQCKIDELAYVVDTTGLDYDDFHTLFRLWLNLSIPITKWVGLGACLVPPDIVEERTVEYAFRWLLANNGNQTSFSRVGFVLDWLTAAMDSECVDMPALDSGYELFYTMLTYEVLTVHAMKLVYTLTKPVDVTRLRVLELLDYAKKRESKKNLLRQLQVLLGLFKSYKPECVPEDVPAISIHTAFKKINLNLLARFKRNQEKRNHFTKEIHHLSWINPLNSDRGRNKKAEPLVPNMEFPNLGSRQYADKEPQKNYLDFSEPVSLLQYSVQRPLSRPARLRALLLAPAGLALLALAPDADHAFLSHDLQHLLTTCFLDGSPHSYAEKQDLLRRLSTLQHTLLQGLPVITRFLAQYLPLWNEKDYFSEILDLAVWLSVESPEQISCIVTSLSRIYHRAQPMEQCAILSALTNMYSNMAYASVRSRQHFMSMKQSEENYGLVLPSVAGSVSELCNKALQVSPDDMRVVYTTSRTAERMAMSEVINSVGVGALPRLLPLAAPLLAPSAALIDKAAALMMLYKKIFTIMKSSNKIRKDEQYVEQIQTLKSYTCDLISCLYSEEALSSRQNGLIFTKLPPLLVDKLSSMLPDADAKFSIRNHIAFAPYTYMQLQAIDHRDADNKLWFDAVVEQEFANLAVFLKKAVPELR
ncbi:uncharacterized protein LOC128670978 [Plodia interpunctella]|uniref:uncharacterized protein LOC128670978 n=1 Tax=Plodia interpunctella TaxID=58824 RepID=UPI0023683E79|nr:uncharacterized protein LOC128670978 [Plodia interpunctella]